MFRRDFTAPEPDRKIYLATVLDCFSRKVVGWSIADHMRTDLVADALRMATRTRGSLDGSVFHSGHGAQYGSRAFAGLCDQLGGRPVDGLGRQQRGQRGLRELPRIPETRDPPRRPPLQRPGHLQENGRWADPLQHPPPVPRQRPPQPQRIRTTTPHR
ncbi:DDE-type integrase/transposase/recombinase [Streptomyces sp. NBC_00233]|uniref:DDE-type integrase/transposase/recombinase n=1 Tax=Streptomyces sp. NBC_00233 TaxID=2975686 RepID=UPI00338E7893